MRNQPVFMYPKGNTGPLLSFLSLVKINDAQWSYNRLQLFLVFSDSGVKQTGKTALRHPFPHGVANGTMDNKHNRST